MQLDLLFHHFRFTDTRQSLTTAADRAERLGLGGLWVMDHVQQIPWQGPVTDPVLEAYTTLGFLAGRTDRVRLGALVSGVSLRDPAMLIKMVTTLDQVSGGRAVLGVGAGWYDREVAALGRVMPPLTERFTLLDDTLRLARETWSGDASPFAGTVLDLPEKLPFPGPVRRPRPPILVGGSGERKTMRLIARYADACNFSFAHATLDDVARRIAVLRERCAEIGRDPATIEITTTRTFGSPTTHDNAERIVRFLHEIAGIGVQRHIFMLDDPADEAAWDLIGDHVLPAARDLAPAFTR